MIKDRMEVTGARWGLDGAEAVLRLRALVGNGAFDDYFAFHLRQVRRRKPHDEEITEEWLGETDEPEIRGVGAHYADEGGWVVEVWAQEFYRQDPLGVELRQRIQAALRAVDGVTDVYEHHNEGWGV